MSTREGSPGKTSSQPLSALLQPLFYPNVCRYSNNTSRETRLRTESSAVCHRFPSTVYRLPPAELGPKNRLAVQAHATLEMGAVGHVVLGGQFGDVQWPDEGSVRG